MLSTRYYMSTTVEQYWLRWGDMAVRCCCCSVTPALAIVTVLEEQRNLKKINKKQRTNWMHGFVQCVRSFHVCMACSHAPKHADTKIEVNQKKWTCNQQLRQQQQEHLHQQQHHQRTTTTQCWRAKMPMQMKWKIRMNREKRTKMVNAIKDDGQPHFCSRATVSVSIFCIACWTTHIHGPTYEQTNRIWRL